MKTDAIRKRIEELVVREGLRPGDRLPTVRQMAADFGCSAPTVQHAVSALVAEGFLTARVGAGTYLAQPHDMPEDAAAAGERPLVGLLLPTPMHANDFLGIAQEGLHETLLAHGYTPLTLHPQVGTTGEARAASELEIVQRLLAHKVCGLIINSAVAIDSPFWTQIARLPVPTVLFNTTSPLAANLDCVYSDNRQGGRLAAEHLIAQGCRRLAFYPAGPQLSSERERILGIQDACAQAGLPPPAAISPENLSMPTAGEYDGFVGSNDIAALQIREKLGAHVPVVGFDASPFSTFMGKRIFPSVAQQTRRLGHLAAEILCRKLKRPTPEEGQMTVILSVKLVPVTPDC